MSKYLFLLCLVSICVQQRVAWAYDALFEKTAPKVMDNSDTGDTSVLFKNFKIEPLGQGVSECDSTYTDTAQLMGPYKYSCRVTVLAKDHGDSSIHKFSAIACRHGTAPQLSRLNSEAAARSMVSQEKFDTAKALGVDYPSRNYSDLRTVLHCVPDSKNPPPAENNEAEDQEMDETKVPAEARPGYVSYTINNHDRYDVSIAFFSGDYKNLKGRNWPTAGSHWTLGKGQSFTYVMLCEGSDPLLYGAWRENQSTEWGSGRNGLIDCSDCSVPCGGVKTTTLGDGGDDAGPPPATFFITSLDRDIVSVKFFSRTRNRVWPATQMLTLNETNHYKLTYCQTGETICYGAYREYQTQNWGVGRDGNLGCDKCCVFCGGTLVVTLGDGGLDSYIQNEPQTSAGSGGDEGNSGVSAADIAAASSLVGSLISGIPHAGAVQSFRPSSGGSMPRQTYVPSGISGGH